MTPALTPRELDVLRQMATGATNGEAARALGISVKTVNQHNTALYAKLGVSGRTQAFLAVGWLRPLPYGSVAP